MPKETIFISSVQKEFHPSSGMAYNIVHDTDHDTGHDIGHDIGQVTGQFPGQVQFYNNLYEPERVVLILNREIMW